MSATKEFERLLDDFARLMSSAIRRVCGDRHRGLIPDIEQEVRLALWKRLQGGERIQYPASYLYKVALTTALSFVRRIGVSVPLERVLPAETPGASTLGALLPVERATLLREALSKLAIEDARAVRAHLAGFSHVEVARIFGWTESVARHRVYRSVGALSKKLERPRKGISRA